MNKEMIISSGDHETRVAILEDDQVVEVFIERENQRGVVGNIYKGRVSKVLPGMQSSFVDIGLERDAFLYVSEVVNTVEEFERLEAGDDEDDVEPASDALGAPSPSRSRRAAAARRAPKRRRGSWRPSSSPKTEPLSTRPPRSPTSRPRPPRRERGGDRGAARDAARGRDPRRTDRDASAIAPKPRSKTCSRKGRTSSSRSSRSRSAPRARA